MIPDWLAGHAWPIVWLMVGWMAHLWSAAREMSAARDERIWPWRFVALRPMRPMRTGASAFGAAGGYAILLTQDVATPGYCFAAGYAADAVLDGILLGEDRPQEPPR